MPTAEAVAVLEGRVLHSGNFADVMDDLAGQNPEVDDTFIDKFVTPGFVEAHCHIQKEGALVNFPWVGAYDRKSADGGLKSGCPDTGSVIDRLHQANANMSDPTAVLVALGWDPNMARSNGLTREMLDSVSETRPIFVLQSNGHIGHCNSAMIRRAEITRHSAEHGVMKDGEGEPTGELRELALGLVLGKHVDLASGGDTSTRNGGILARIAGCTTVTDLAYSATTKAVAAYSNVVNTAEFPARVVYAPMVQVLNPRLKEGTLDHILGLSAGNTDKFRMGPVKFIIDGSIQGRSARMNWPGYCCGDPNGMWLAEPDEMFEMMRPYHRAGLQLALHTNGDEAVDRGLDVYEMLLVDHPRFDHRHRLEHAQLATENAFRRMKALGVCVNLFANHVWYWGDTHRTVTAGPARARRLDACGTAERWGVPFSIHSDAPVTPLDPLFTMWCAVNRFTSGGHVLGESERISPMQALRAVTIDGAYLLKADHMVGSIEAGKFADFAVLDENPLAVDPAGIKDIRIAATVLAGKIHPN
jgi:predicted amidohydrolase YtcJ